MFSTDRRAAKKIRDGRIEMMAVAWFTRMRSDERSADDERRFNVWLEAAPEHKAAYAGIGRTFEATRSLAGNSEIMAMRREAMQRRPALRLLTSAPRCAAAAALAASLVLVLAGTMNDSLLPKWRGQNVHQTERGERSTVALVDGTLVTLTSDSRLVADYSQETRRVRLEKGEAYFDVMPDAERRFVVQAGSGEITALGTEFDVYKKNGEVVVTLVEGEVEVATLDKGHTDEKSVKLQAGEQVSYDKGELAEVRTVDAGRAVWWRNGLLFVSEEPFIEVVEELNRHSRYKLLLDKSDPRLREIRINGAFRPDHPERLVEFLKDSGVAVWTVNDSSGNIRLRLYPGRSED